MFSETYTVKQLRNALLALSNRKTKSVKKRMAYARLNNMLDWLGWEDQKEVTLKDLYAIPSVGKKTVDTVLCDWRHVLRG